MSRPLRLLVALGIISGLATAATLGCVAGWWRGERESGRMTMEPLHEVLARLRAMRDDLEVGVRMLEAIERTERSAGSSDRVLPVGTAARAALDVLRLLRVWDLDYVGARACPSDEARDWDALDVVYRRPVDPADESR